MDFIKEHFDEIALLLALLGFSVLYAIRPTADTKGWVDTIVGALILALTGGGVRSAISVMRNGNKPPEVKQ